MVLKIRGGRGGKFFPPFFLSFFLGFLFFLLAPAPAPAQIPSWLEPFFIEGGGQYYFAPGLLRDHVRPSPGFRGALGYEWRRFRVSAESGFTRIDGTNPLVLDIALAPLLFRAGYTFPLAGGLGLKPELALGFAFSKTGHYPSVIDMFLRQKRDSETRSFFSAFRLDLAYAFPGGFISLYAGGGLDLIAETGGLIPLPAFGAGLSLKPFALAARAAGRRATGGEEGFPGIFRRGLPYDISRKPKRNGIK
jgi:hypothetical protein